MGNKRTVWFAWALCGLVICLSAAVFGAGLLSQDGSKSELQIVGDAFLLLVLPVVFIVVATLVVTHQPRNTTGWLLMIPVALVLVIGPIQQYLTRIAPTAPEPTLLLLLMVWFSSWSWLLLIFPLLLIPLLFPDGRPPTPRWRWVGVAVIVWAALFVLLGTMPKELNSLTTPELRLDNPIGFLSLDTVERLASVWVGGLMVLVLLCMASLFVRYRRAGYTEREQIKWLLYACAVFLVVYVGGGVSGLGEAANLVGYVWQVLFGVSLVAFPVAIGIAILRYHLWDIEVIIRRTLVYGVLTAALALFYFGGVALLQSLSQAITGGGQDQPQWVIVASTLAIAALFQPLRRRIHSVIDQRFYRRRYDAAQTLAGFSAHLRDEVDLDRIGEELVAVVHETVQPEHVSLWLRPSEHNR